MDGAVRAHVQVRRVAVPLHIVRRTAAPHAADASVQTLAGKTMGTRWSVKLVAPAGEPLHAVQAAIEMTLDRIVAQMSTYEAQSDISRFNRAPAGTCQVLPDEFFRVLQYALEVARDSDGAYDPTVGSLVGLWGFGALGQRFAIPSMDEIAALRGTCGWDRIQLDKTHRTATQPGGIHLDLSSVAKGFAVDRVAEVLRDLGCTDFLVEVGGELRGAGVKPDGLPWWVALERPPTPDGLASISDIVIALNDLAVATSGSAEHFFDAGGHRYSHTIDPRSGAPVAHDLVSVSVLHRECMHADALATALSVLGPEEGMAHAERLGLAARFVSAGRDGLRERLTPRLAAMLA